MADNQSDSWNIRDELKGLSLSEIQDEQRKGSLPFSVCLLNLTGDLNVGMAVRTACVFGAQEVIIFGRRKYDRRTTVGAQNYVPVDRIDGLCDDETLSVKKFVDTMNEKGLFPIFVEQGGRTIDTLGYMAWIDVLLDDDPRKPCLVFGNEGDGIPQSFLEKGVTISIPQRGVLRSLNVASAAAIAIYYFQDIVWRAEYDREKIKKGLKEVFGNGEEN